MKSIELYRAFCGVDDDILERSETAAGQTSGRSATHKLFTRRFPAALVVAILALLLMGAGVAAVVYGDSIQDWFRHYWEVITGQQMSEEQAAIIEHLSQEIGSSQTVGDVTVTVDSATVGYDNLFLLVRVKGPKLSNRYGYGFGQFNLDVTPDPIGSGGISGFGFQTLGAGGDGSVLLLMKYDYASRVGNERDTSPVHITLTLENLVQHTGSGRDKLLETGKWSFEFSLDRSKEMEVIQLPDTEVQVATLDKQDTVSITVTNVELTSTGLNYQYDYADGTASIDSFDIHVILRNGACVPAGSGSGTPSTDRNTWNCSINWYVPINLNDAVCVQIGDTEILIP